MGLFKRLMDGEPVDTLKRRRDFVGLLKNIQSSDAERRLAATEAYRELVVELREKLDQVPIEEAAAFMVGQRDKATSPVGIAFSNLERAFDPLMQAANSSDPAVREFAYTTVAQIITGHTRNGMAATRLQRGFLMIFLSRGLKDKDPSVRKATAQAMGEYLASAEFVNKYLAQAASELVQRLEEPDPVVRDAIVKALRRGQNHIVEGMGSDHAGNSPWPRAAAALGITMQPSAAPATSSVMAAATLPPPPGTIPEAVETLLSIYEQYPDGFAPGYGDAHAYEQVREIGKALNDTGGMERMLQAHADFSHRTRTPGAPRNLEHAWDRIGEWLG
jgi:HEAT repeat protein